jgi:hypothetical protein
LGEGTAGGEAEHEVAGGDERVPVDPEQLGYLARDLGHAHPQIDLRRRGDGEAVDQRLVLAQVAAGDLPEFLGLGRIAHRTVEDDAAVYRLHLDPGVGGDLAQDALQAGQVMLDRDLAAQQHLLVAVDRVERRRAAAPAEDVDQGRGMRLHVGHVRIGDEHGGGGPGELDQLALVYLEDDGTRGRDQLGRRCGRGRAGTARGGQQQAPCQGHGGHDPSERHGGERAEAESLAHRHDPPVPWRTLTVSALLPCSSSRPVRGWFSGRSTGLTSLSQVMPGETGGAAG